MKVKTSEASGRVLDYLVAKALGHHRLEVRTWQDLTRNLDPKEDVDLIAFHRERKSVRVSSEQVPGSGMFPTPCYSTNPAQAWPIIEREIHTLIERDGTCTAECFHPKYPHPNRFCYSMKGETKLIAAMRCYVVSRLGPEVEVPEELK